MSKLTKALTAAAGNAGESLYAEDVFSTYLYDGTGAAHTITNGIDLSGEGGLTWIKARDIGYSHQLFDTERGATKQLYSNTTGGETTAATSFTSFNSDGFSLGALNGVNNPSQTFASWTFRKAEKFFDVVTYTGTGDAAPGQTVAHNLGSTPGFIIIKRTDSASDWSCYHNGLTSSDYYLRLNNTTAENEDGTVFPSAPTDSNFYVRADRVNASGGTFVAYLFASDAGGFGDDGSENIIKCGSYTGSGDTAPYVVSVDLGFEPQWLLVKNVTTGGGGKNWLLVDTMRGFHATGADKELRPNTSDADNDSSAFNVTSTGFSSGSGGEPNIQGNTYIYIAIRRPMKTPESGTEVFDPIAYTGNASTRIIGTNFAIDTHLNIVREAGSSNLIASRLTGAYPLETRTTDAQQTVYSDYLGFDNQTGIEFKTGTAYTQYNSSARTYVSYNFKRATGFMDVVAYTGTGSNATINHNLGVAPELMIVKRRNSARVWAVWASGIDIDDYLTLNGNAGVATFGLWQSTLPTATQITLGTDASVNGSGDTYIAYLFATLAGVSKVGSYTGTGADLNVDCGFSAGARFILIKRTDSTGDWYVWDSARGIVAGNDPYRTLNTEDAEVTNTDYIDPLSSGFTVTSGASFDGLNNSGGNYIFLAIA
jgi:hypothetical protein